MDVIIDYRSIKFYQIKFISRKVLTARLSPILFGWVRIMQILRHVVLFTLMDWILYYRFDLNYQRARHSAYWQLQGTN